ncbi:MAG: hypothetical protein HY261_11035, partial [Chloroflexi bacterium]|nr:hypothetical protein [Chloroflexota bacterium]
MTSMPTHKPYMPASMGELSPDPDTKDFWDACNKGDLRIQKCSQCGKFRYPPQPGCVKCGSMKYDWMKSSGKGKVFSFSLVYHPVLPVFAEY